MTGPSPDSPPVEAASPGEAAKPQPSWRHAAIDFIYPPACAVCRKEVPARNSLCGRCKAALSAGPADVCQRCCAPVGPFLDTTQGCIHCRTDRFHFRRVFALGPYDGPLRAACLQIKQDPTDRLSRVLCDLLIDRWGAALRALQVDLLVPIPAHWTTRITRTARPADAISQRLGAFLKAPCDLHILRKARRTPAQSSLTPARRRENLRDAFRQVAGTRLNGARVLLVDDVLTTGTTADRAARVLQQAGCVEMHVAVIARGIGR